MDISNRKIPSRVHYMLYWCFLQMIPKFFSAMPCRDNIHQNLLFLLEKSQGTLTFDLYHCNNRKLFPIIVSFRCLNLVRLVRFCSNNLVGSLPHDIYAYNTRCMRIHLHSSRTDSSKKTGFVARYSIMSVNSPVNSVSVCRMYVFFPSNCLPGNIPLWLV